MTLVTCILYKGMGLSLFTRCLDYRGSLMKNQESNIHAEPDDIVEDDHEFNDRDNIQRGGGLIKTFATIALACAAVGAVWWKLTNNHNTNNAISPQIKPPVNQHDTEVVPQVAKPQNIQNQQNTSDVVITTNPVANSVTVTNPSSNSIVTSMATNPVANSVTVTNPSSSSILPSTDATPNLGQLPNWDLSDIYKSIDDPKIALDISKVDQDSSKFSNEFKGKVTKLDSKLLFMAIKRYEDILERLGRLGSFASLNMSIDSTNESNKTLASNINIKAGEIGAKLAFFTLELSKISKKKLDTMYKQSSSLLTYRPFLYDVSRFKDHMLSEDVEQYSARHSVTNGSWSDLFDEIWSRMRFDVNGKTLTSEEVVTIYQTNPDRLQRAAAAHAMENSIKNNSYLFSFITNTLAREKSIEDDIRSYSTPISHRNISNNIEDNIVDLMISTVKSRYKDTSHRYYKIKAKLLGLNKLAYYDRSAPLLSSKRTIYQWNEARELVLSSYNAFSPKMGQIAEQFFTKRWIDAPAMPNKRGGAFCAGVSPSLHPYILVNYLGTSRDVSTLGHELGHGIHDILASKYGYLTTQPPLTLAETASIFGEELVFTELLKRTVDKNEKIALLASKIEDSIATIISQTAYAEFEKRVHEAIKMKNNLTMENMSEIWISVQKEALGDVFDLDGYQYHWMRIPHFIHTPFYVYSYTFGNLLVNALYNTYSSNKIPNFQDKYIALLASGGTKGYAELLESFNLNATTTQFWNSGIDVLVARIDEFEKLVSESMIQNQSGALNNDATIPTQVTQKQLESQPNNNVDQLDQDQSRSKVDEILPPTDTIVAPKIPKI